MPQVSAAVFRSTPSSTSASASIRRAAVASRLFPAAQRSSAAVSSILVIATADDISLLVCLYGRESEIRRFGNPQRVTHGGRWYKMHTLCTTHAQGVCQGMHAGRKVNEARGARAYSVQSSTARMSSSDQPRWWAISCTRTWCTRRSSATSPPARSTPRGSGGGRARPRRAVGLHHHRALGQRHAVVEPGEVVGFPRSASRRGCRRPEVGHAEEEVGAGPPYLRRQPREGLRPSSRWKSASDGAAALRRSAMGRPPAGGASGARIP